MWVRVPPRPPISRDSRVPIKMKTENYTLTDTKTGQIYKRVKLTEWERAILNNAYSLNRSKLRYYRPTELHPAKFLFAET